MAVQGSRAGLITAVVVFVILFVVATVFAIYYGVESNRVAQELETFQRKVVPTYLPTGFEANTELVGLRDLQAEYATNNVIDTVLAQRDLLSRKIAGTVVTAQDARKQTEDTLKASADAINLAKAGVTVPTGENLLNAIRTLTTGVTSKQQQIGTLQQQVQQVKTDADRRITDLTTQLTTRNDDVRKAQAEAQASLSTAQTDITTKQQNVEAIEKAIAEERGSTTEAINKLTSQVSDKDKEISLAKEQVEGLQARLGLLRVGTTDAIVRRVDGNITRLASADIVYVNLGYGDQVTPGLTFEVFDKNDGVPGLSPDETQIPSGKASLEITRVGATSSEARITRQVPGTQLFEGDLLVNLVYDRNTKFNFLVYGDFDMDQNGIATPSDADIVKRLVTQFGGKVVNQVTVNTDFIVMGRPLEAIKLSPEEQNDPQLVKKQADIDNAITAYDEVLGQAQALNVPVLNQNRFLYFVGYFDQARR